MKFFKKKKSKSGARSDIKQFRSPYLAKPIIPNKKRKKKLKKNKPILSAPTRLTTTRKGGFKKLFFLTLFIIVISAIVYIGFFSQTFLIREYQIHEDGTLITNNLKLNEILEQKALRHNLLLLNQHDITQTILKEFPEVQSVNLNRVFPNKISLEIKKFPTIANLINIVKTSDGMQFQKKYLMNENGIITTENEENPDLPYITIETKEAMEINTLALSKDKIDFIIHATALFEEKIGMKVLEADYLRVEREVHLKTDKLFEVWIDMTKSPVSQVDKLKKALPKLDIYKTPLEYIDLRISGTDAEKVIFKRRK